MPFSCFTASRPVMFSRVIRHTLSMRAFLRGDFQLVLFPKLLLSPLWPLRNVDFVDLCPSPCTWSQFYILHSFSKNSTDGERCPCQTEPQPRFTSFSKKFWFPYNWLKSSPSLPPSVCYPLSLAVSITFLLSGRSESSPHHKQYPESGVRTPQKACLIFHSGFWTINDKQRLCLFIE